MKLRTFFRYLRPRYLLTCKTGRCTLCRKPTVFLLTGEAGTIRNHAVCARCGSCSRHRHVALLVQREFRDAGIAGLEDFRRRGGLRVFNASTTSPIAKRLGAGPNILCSEYFDGVEPGQLKDGILNQDLQRLTFADASLDLVITEDVFEHVEDYRLGFREVHRVLKRGGVHVFSIPYHFDRRTRELFEMRDGGRVLHEPVEYHGDPIRGRIPCYTHLGYDLLDCLRDIGFDTRIEISGYADASRYATFDCYTFVSRKR